MVSPEATAAVLVATDAAPIQELEAAIGQHMASAAPASPASGDAATPAATATTFSPEQSEWIENAWERVKDWFDEAHYFSILARIGSEPVTAEGPESTGVAPEKIAETVRGVNVFM